MILPLLYIREKGIATETFLGYTDKKEFGGNYG